MKPTQEQILQWARDAGYMNGGRSFDVYQYLPLVNLAYEAGRKDENEACVKVCEQPVDEIQITDDCSEYKYRDNQECADAIRARREHG